VITTLATQQPHHPGPPPHPGTHPRPAQDPGGATDRACAVILRPIAEHADGPTDDDVWHELAGHGLHQYITRTAAAVGAGPEAAWSEWADAPSAYIALGDRLPDHPDRDAALIWAAERGWAVAVETGCGEDLLITASLGGDVLPPPETVAAFVRGVFCGRHTGIRGRTRAVASADLTRRLVDWAGQEPTLDNRTG
jgi:hypothetical protein